MCGPLSHTGSALDYEKVLASPPSFSPEADLFLLTIHEDSLRFTLLVAGSEKILQAV